MPRTCTVCGSANRNEIEAAIIRSEPLRRIAKQWLVSATALSRHRDSHLPVPLEVAKRALEVEVGESLGEQARRLHARATGILERAETAGQLDIALRAIRELRGILELLGKLDGQLAERATTQRIEVHYIDKQVVLQGASVHPSKCIPGGES